VPADPSEVLGRADQLRHLRHWAGVVRGTLADGDLDARVPACPDWDLRALGHHVGDLHRWVVGAIVEGHPNTPSGAGPADRGALLEWFDDGAATFLELLSTVDPDRPCWAFGPKPTTAAFWLRRQPHEHAVHGWDALASQSARRPLDAGLIDRALALDGIDEVVGMFFPRQVRLGRTPPLAHALEIAPDDGAGRTWRLAGEGSSSGADPGSVGGTDARVSGPAEALYLLLWHRTAMDDPRITVTGDASAARSVLGVAVAP
jgi:uncharacterized protein (TIGR03083 family)